MISLCSLQFTDYFSIAAIVIAAISIIWHIISEVRKNKTILKVSMSTTSRITQKPKTKEHFIRVIVTNKGITTDYTGY